MNELNIRFINNSKYKTLIGIIDTEAHNIGSIKNCLNYLKIKSKIIKSPKDLMKIDHVILPGVGAYDAVVESLYHKKFFKEDLKKIFLKKKVLAICVGMQILFSESEEGKKNGLSFFNGKIKHLKKIKCKDAIPHVGFNSIKLNKIHKMISSIFEKDFYFTHTYALDKNEIDKKFNGIYGLTKYGGTEFISFLSFKNIIATQFHPEKSGTSGLKLLKYFYDKKKNNI